MPSLQCSGTSRVGLVRHRGAAAGLLPDTTFHDLRPIFASTALTKGVPISEVSRWLGHKWITTVDLHGHLVPEASGRARDALDRAFTRR